MDVAPGELIHMDENGACKFPADKLELILDLSVKLRAEENERIGRLQKAKSAAELRAIFGGHSYAAKKK
jgi:regulator of RNase E activity RraA